MESRFDPVISFEGMAKVGLPPQPQEEPIAIPDNQSSQPQPPLMANSKLAWTRGLAILLSAFKYSYLHRFDADIDALLFQKSSRSDLIPPPSQLAMLHDPPDKPLFRNQRSVWL